MGRDCKREKRGKNWGEINIKSKKLGRDCNREKIGKNWGEIYINPNEWGEKNIKPDE